MYRALQQQLLIERYLRETEREMEQIGGGTGNRLGEARLRSESRQSQSLANRLESARVERALAAAGLI